MIGFWVQPCCSCLHYKAAHVDQTLSMNATGEPDTPVEVLADLLGKAVAEKDAGKLAQLVSQAHRIVQGLDPYLDRISTPPSKVNGAPSCLYGFVKQLRVLSVRPARTP